MAKEKQKRYGCFEDIFLLTRKKKLSNEQIGILFMAIFDYQRYGIVSEIEDPVTDTIFCTAMMEYDRYLEICEKRAENGSKGGTAKAENQMLANASNSYQSVANASKSKQSLPHIISSQVISNQINSDQGGETGVQGEKPDKTAWEAFKALYPNKKTSYHCQELFTALERSGRLQELIENTEFYIRTKPTIFAPMEEWLAGMWEDYSPC